MLHLVRGLCPYVGAKLPDGTESPITIAHCVSQCGTMGGGYALDVPIEHKKLFRAANPKGLYFRTQIDKQVYYHLITKSKVYHKPTQASFEQSVQSFAEDVKDQTIYTPQLGCGLDRLSWQFVYDLCSQVAETHNINWIMFNAEGLV